MLGSFIIKSLLSDILARIGGKLVEGIVSERFITRVMMWALFKLSRMSSNTLDDELLSDLALEMNKADLPQALIVLRAARLAEIKSNA
ncbi:hypothetical protein EDC56_1270 [Sinobacterium caligoides]|uniref:Uncharacterized protein n=1 Tax=Sinobacterium caligoides TaxID=933926 RepID=A0A3N2E0T9_9GAMM|nr:hypothetical protein [Sinobacterium caligoides]ROS05720.1 hypothetical protein EDC56_1270 [Sinobacterium caligoides]